MTLSVGVGIVNYNTVSALRSCLESLSGQPGIDAVIVADNGSTDGSLAMVEREFADVGTVSLPSNPGYGAAANVLAGTLATDVVVVLNADVRMPTGAISELRDHLVAHPNAAVVGPRLVGDDGRLQRSCFPDPSVSELLWAESGAHRFRRPREVGGLQSFAHDEVRSVPWVLGAVLAIRRTAFDQVGGFDPGFFLYYEEVDLCRRLRADGWEVHFTAAAEVHHEGGASIGQRHELGQRTLYRSLHRYHSKHGTASIGALRLAVSAVMVARLARDRLRARCSRTSVARASARASSAAWRGVLTDARDGWSVPTVAQPRRLDWLALLPDVAAAPTVAMLGNCDPIDRDVVASHLGADVVRCELGDDAFDVVVVVSDSPIDLTTACSAVRPGGVLYVERQRGRAKRGWSSAAAARRSAESSELTVVAQHWLVPDSVTPTRLVPLDDDHAVRWYLDHLFTATSRLTALARVAVRRFPALLYRMAPSHGMVARRGDRQGPGLLTRCPADIGLHGDDRLLFLTSGYDVGSRSVIMPFGRDHAGPSCVMKVSPRPEVNETTRREYDTLVALRTQLSADLLRSVPQPLATFEWRRRFVSVESLFGGETLETRLRRERNAIARAAMLSDVAAWVTEFHLQTAEPVPWSAAMTERWIRPEFDRFAQEYDVADPVRALFERSLQRCEQLVDVALPIVRRHMDMGPWNVICTSDGIGVIDWETSTNRADDGRGLPVCDLSYFVKYWLHVVLDAADLDAEVSLFTFLTSDDPEVEAAVADARSALRSYCADLGIDERFVAVLTLYNWVEHANNAAVRHRLLGRDGPAPRSQAVAFVEAIADHADELFADPIDVISGAASQETARRQG